MSCVDVIKLITGGVYTLRWISPWSFIGVIIVKSIILTVCCSLIDVTSLSYVGLFSSLIPNTCIDQKIIICLVLDVGRFSISSSDGLELI